MKNNGLSPEIQNLIHALIWLSGFVLAIAALIFARNLLSPNLWFDESGQFLLAIGQFHFAPQQSEYGSLLDSWRHSKSFSLDPGGFTVLLRVAIDIFGTQPLVLRALPFIFALMPAALLIILAKSLKLSIGFSIFSLLILFSDDNYLYFAHEVRPYSMECCGVAAILLATCYLIKNFQLKNLLSWALVCGLFMSSRYSALIYVVSSCFTIISVQFLLERKIHLKTIFGVTLLAALAFGEYYFMLRYQTTGGTPPSYVNEFILKGKDLGQTLGLLKTNYLGHGKFLSGRQVVFKTLFLLSSPFYFYWIKRRGEFNRITDSTLLCLFIYVVVSELLWMMLSLTGKMPWKFGTRWALSEIVLCSLSFLGLAYIFKFFSTHYFQRFYKYTLLLLAVVLLISTIYVSRGVIKYSRLDYEGENLLKILPLANQASAGKGTIVMDQFLYPDYRYLVEFSGAGIEPLAGKVMFADFANLSALKGIENSAARPVLFISGQWDSNRRIELIHSLSGSRLIDRFSKNNFMYILQVD